MSNPEVQNNRPKGVRGFVGRGSVEDNRRPFTLTDLHKGELPDVAYTIDQLHTGELPVKMNAVQKVGSLRQEY